MSKRYAMVLDLGKGNAKALGCLIGEGIPSPDDLRREIFKTKLYNLNKGYTELQGNSYKVEFNDNTVILGEQGTDKSFETSKTTELHQICAYTLITKFLEPDTTDNEVNIVLACPVTVLRNVEHKQDYKNLIKGNGPIKIRVNDKNYEFTINEVLIKAESSGVLYLVPEEFKDKKVGLIDLGGLNMTVTILTNGVCVNPDNDRIAKEYGSNELINRLSKSLTSYSGGNIIDFDKAEEALERGHLSVYGKPDVKSTEVIELTKKEFLDQALYSLASNHIKVKNLDKLIFVGGTSIYLKDQIKQLPNGQTTDNPQWSSIEGLFKIAVKKFIG